MPSQAYMRNRELDEEARHNKEQEKIAKAKMIADTAVGILSAGASFGGRVIPGLARMRTAKVDKYGVMSDPHGYHRSAGGRYNG